MTGLLNSLFHALSPLWEMSLTAAYAAAIVAALRLILKKKAPRQVLCLLWLVVFARLLIPVSLESPLSIVPDAEQVQLAQNLPSTLTGTGTADPAQDNDPAPKHTNGVTVNPTVQGNAVPTITAPSGTAPTLPTQPEEPGFPWQAVIAGVWLAGALAMGGYGLISYLRLRRRLYDAIRARDGAWEHPSVGSPFILGVIRPRIYLPAGLWGMPRKFILCHERAHLRRLDHLVKPICWAALALHWFNPAVWLAFILMSRDIEAACDEAVIRQLGPRVKADYSATLLSLATNGRVPAPCPLAFDEGDAKGRIQNVLRYRRPALWIVVVSVIAAVLAAVCLLTDPVSAEEPDPDPDPSSQVSASQAPEGGLNHLLDPWMLEVLNGERNFRRSYGDQQDFSIHQLRSYFYGDQELPKVTVELGELAIIDLDRDGISELVIWPTGEHEDPTEVGYYTGYLILRREGDVVYAYDLGYRAFGSLKSDGTFHWAGSAFNWGIGTLSFTGPECTTNEVTWCDNGTDEHYFVNGVTATREEFEAATAAQDAKPEPTWYVFENGQLKALSTAASINVPIPLDEEALSVAVPDFLDEEQQTVYRQAHVMYSHIFGANTEDVDYWPEVGIYGPSQMTFGDYNPATGLYANWNDFYEAVLSVFTQEFWDTKNNFGDGLPIYKNIDGQLHYIAAARGSGGYNGYFPETFRLVEKTDDAISFVMTGYYSDDRQFMDTATNEQRAAWLAAGWENSIDFPMRMVRTENGWRFDEFHNAGTDNGLPEFSSQAVPNPNAPVPPGSATPEPTPSGSSEPTASASPKPADSVCAHGLEDVRTEYMGSQLMVICNLCGFTYQVPGVTSANWDGMTGPSDGSGWMKEDMDGDGRTELTLYLTTHQIVSLKVVNGALVVSSFDPQVMIGEFNRNRTYTMDFDNGIMEISYNGYTRQTSLDPSYLNHGAGVILPELQYAWCNRLTVGFHIVDAQGAELGIAALWSLSYDPSGRLQMGSFIM